MRRVFLTGARGFVGSRLAHFYRNQWDIEGPSHSQVELTSREQVESALAYHRAQLVIHTAALSNTGLCQQNPLESFKANVQATQVVANACKKAGAKLVFFSSDQVYAGVTQQGPIAEETVLHPPTVYGRHKLEAEQLVLEACPDAVCLRATWMYDWNRPGLKDSPGFWGLLQQVMEHKEPLPQLAVREYRGITWVQPIVQAMETLTQLPGGVYNLGAKAPLNTYASGLMCLERMGADTRTQALLKPDEERWQEQGQRNLNMDTGKLYRACGLEFGDTVSSLEECWKAYQEQEGGSKV